mmetsp:Transcript_25852/g.43353  ORF Transcript_25852/g.43353 Transcript_25852/m.43353 type:complete len:227 (+) Transcript_25852:133-813(+)
MVIPISGISKFFFLHPLHPIRTASTDIPLNHASVWYTGTAVSVLTVFQSTQCISFMVTEATFRSPHGTGSHCDPPLDEVVFSLALAGGDDVATGRPLSLSATGRCPRGMRSAPLCPGLLLVSLFLRICHAMAPTPTAQAAPSAQAATEYCSTGVSLPINLRQPLLQPTKPLPLPVEELSSPPTATKARLLSIPSSPSSRSPKRSSFGVCAGDFLYATTLDASLCSE